MTIDICFAFVDTQIYFIYKYASHAQDYAKFYS